ncbi:uncharacterized protein BP5553_05399 [Venustampulla echinocandica]|uniref:F-box domain-containing protein n=1 Tax=Venustampulla echinocandica TaxID=2656787 RepID=A0A370TR09_9HELO|nr:uncharacterized protein BP5553_05399 [Venustampulla echinocandica]RDL37966.1 hypothetical protein BP5553_05399 [Venustampulla echinocandica]
MVSLLDIPREVRHKILTFVVSTPKPPPSGHSDAGPRIRLPYSPCKGWHRNVQYCPHMNRTKEFSTLLVNRQLHDETLAAIDLLSRKPTYILDIMVVDGRSLWPTWLSVPALSKSVDIVYSTLRIDTTSSDMTMSGFQRGSGGFPLITLSFYGVLERFLRVGPAVNPALQEEELISINILEIDVETPEERRGIQPSPESLKEFRCGWDTQPLRSELLVGFITTYISILLYMGYHTAEYGSILYERIGTIRVLRDGKLEREWDMAKGLRDIKFDESIGNVTREERSEYFKKWKLQAYETRAQLGLPVLPLDEDSTTST